MLISIYSFFNIVPLIVEFTSRPMDRTNVIQPGFPANNCGLVLSNQSFSIASNDLLQSPEKPQANLSWQPIAQNQCAITYLNPTDNNRNTLAMLQSVVPDPNNLALPKSDQTTIGQGKYT
jgi:hypothetical protein